MFFFKISYPLIWRSKILETNRADGPTTEVFSSFICLYFVVHEQPILFQWVVSRYQDYSTKQLCFFKVNTFGITNLVENYRVHQSRSPHISYHLLALWMTISEWKSTKESSYQVLRTLAYSCWQIQLPILPSVIFHISESYDTSKHKQHIEES